MTHLDSTSIENAAARLDQARRHRIPCAPVRDLLPSRDPATGYAVQQVLTASRIAGGAHPIGHKIGLTAPSVQQQLGVDQPDFGVLFDDMVWLEGQVIESRRLLQPRIEAEVAFVLSGDLDGPLDETTVREAAGDMVAALEIVDSRVADWDITIVDTVADNASSGLFVLGAERIPLRDQDLRTVEMTMTDARGQRLSSGTGSACLGDPVAALCWLARTKQELGEPLRAGDVVLSGALGPMVPVVPGETYTATITGIGRVVAEFAVGR